MVIGGWFFGCLVEEMIFVDVVVDVYVYCKVMD